MGQVVNLRDRFRGPLIGGTIGDGMGRANEGRQASEARTRKIREYQLWAGWSDGPKGTITDDIQMTMWLAESILDAGQRASEAGVADLREYLLDPDDLARRFTREHIRGIGQATREFVRNYKDFERSWYEARGGGCLGVDGAPWMAQSWDTPDPQSGTCQPAISSAPIFLRLPPP